MATTRTNSSPKASIDAFEQKLLAEAKESHRSEPVRLSISFLKGIKEVRVLHSRYHDGCYAQIVFASGKSTACSLDYYVQAEPGDKLRLSSLRWVDVTNQDGENIRILTGEVL